MNHKTDNIIVIASYPRKHEVHGPLTVGVASYTKNTLQALIKSCKRHGRKPTITVLAEQLPGDDQPSYRESGVTIERLWKRNNPLSFILLIHTLITQPSGTQLVFAFEFAMFGSPLTIPFIPFLMCIAKMKRMRASLVLHQMVDDITNMTEHIGVNQYWQIDGINIGLRMFYRIVGVLADTVIVFEQVFADMAKAYIPVTKITVIPHGVETHKKSVSRETARKHLGIHDDTFILLAFGYIASYKGTDWIAKVTQLLNKKKNVKLIIAGGPNPNHVGKLFYDRYVAAVQHTAHMAGGAVTISGYVNEQDIPYYFAAADAAIFPYRTLMSSSGPLSFAALYHTPILVSTHLIPLFRTKDLKAITESYALESSDFSFSMENGGIVQTVNHLMESDNLQKTLSTVAAAIEKTRSFDTIGEQYYQTLFTLHTSGRTTLAFEV